MTPIIYAYQLTYLDTSVFAVFAHPRKRHGSSNTSIKYHPRFRSIYTFFRRSLEGKVILSLNSNTNKPNLLADFTIDSLCFETVYNLNKPFNLFDFRKKLTFVYNEFCIQKWTNSNGPFQNGG